MRPSALLRRLVSKKNQKRNTTRVRVNSNENLTEERSFTQKKILPNCPPPFFDFADLAGAAVVEVWVAWAGTLFVAAHAIHTPA
jgi:hypothetical protein